MRERLFYPTRGYRFPYPPRRRCCFARYCSFGRLKVSEEYATIKISPKQTGVTEMKKQAKVEIAPKCEYCVHARPSPDGETVLCPKKGVVEKDSKCRKYKYDILKRQPKHKPKLQEFSAEDFEL